MLVRTIWNMSILIVDDDHDSLMLLLTMLRSEGMQVLTADNGYAALELLERQSTIDLVLLDIQMPVINGVQTLNLIRERDKDLKVIAQSAHALVGDRDRTIAAEGFDDYLSNPFSKSS